MRLALLVLAAAVLLSPTINAQSSVLVHEVDIEPVATDRGDYVRLSTGEVIFGEVALSVDRGVPQFVLIGDDRIANHHVHSYRIGHDVFAFADVGLPRPLLVEQISGDRVEVFREAGNDADGIEFFRIRNEPVIIASGAHLRTALADDPEAMRHLRRDQSLGRIGMGGFVVGAGIVLAGATVQFADLDAPVSGAVLAGSGVALGWLVNPLVAPARQQARRAALDAYNR